MDQVVTFSLAHHHIHHPHIPSNSNTNIQQPKPLTSSITHLSTTSSLKQAINCPYAPYRKLSALSLPSSPHLTKCPSQPPSGNQYKKEWLTNDSQCNPSPGITTRPIFCPTLDTWPRYKWFSSDLTKTNDNMKSNLPSITRFWQQLDKRWKHFLVIESDHRPTDKQKNRRAEACSLHAGLLNWVMVVLKLKLPSRPGHHDMACKFNRDSFQRQPHLHNSNDQFDHRQLFDSNEIFRWETTPSLCFVLQQHNNATSQQQKITPAHRVAKTSRYLADAHSSVCQYCSYYV